jgi:hypothetical protein
MYVTERSVELSNDEKDTHEHIMSSNRQLMHNTSLETRKLCRHAAVYFIGALESGSPNR